MRTTSSFYRCDNCGNEASVGEGRPNGWQQINMNYENEKASGWLFSADICDACWSRVRGCDRASKQANLNLFHKLWKDWLEMLWGIK